MAIRALLVLFVLVPLVGLAGCGGMNRAVMTVPRTFEDLGAKTSRLGEEAAGPPSRKARHETRRGREGAISPK